MPTGWSNIAQWDEWEMYHVWGVGGEPKNLHSSFIPECDKRGNLHTECEVTLQLHLNPKLGVRMWNEFGWLIKRPSDGLFTSREGTLELLNAPRWKCTASTVKPRFTNASDHEQFGLRTKFSEHKASRMTYCVSSYELWSRVEWCQETEKRKESPSKQ